VGLRVEQSLIVFDLQGLEQQSIDWTYILIEKLYHVVSKTLTDQNTASHSNKTPQCRAVVGGHRRKLPGEQQNFKFQEIH
jgi:hypothetical protein